MSGIRSLTRRPTVVGFASAASCPIYCDSDDNILKFIPAGSGTTEVQIIDASSAQTLTTKTLTSPTINTPTIVGGTATGTTHTGDINGDTKVLAAQADYAAVVAAATVPGWTWAVTAAGTYTFEIELPTIMTTNGGLTVSFKLTTATLTSIQYATYAATAADNATAVSTNGTTTTDGTKMFDSKTAAYTVVRITGSMVVNAGGTFDIQACQNTSAGAGDTTSIRLGAKAKLTRVL